MFRPYFSFLAISSLYSAAFCISFLLGDSIHQTPSPIKVIPCSSIASLKA
ncbi:MAG: hypothetical protein QXP05_04905 [Ignisphaera sp.]